MTKNYCTQTFTKKIYIVFNFSEYDYNLLIMLTLFRFSVTKVLHEYECITFMFI